MIELIDIQARIETYEHALLKVGIMSSLIVIMAYLVLVEWWCWTCAVIATLVLCAAAFWPIMRIVSMVGDLRASLAKLRSDRYNAAHYEACIKTATGISYYLPFDWSYHEPRKLRIMCQILKTPEPPYVNPAELHNLILIYSKKFQ